MRLIELLIVVVVLGILAAAVIPQFTNSSREPAMLSQLDTNLADLRGAVELYYHQHNSTYPGAVNATDGNPTVTAAEAEVAFVKQMTWYSDKDGRTSSTRSDVYKYGPYLRRSMPANPYNDLSTVVCDISTTDVTQAMSDGTTGWKFCVRTGAIFANDGAHSSR